MSKVIVFNIKSNLGSYNRPQSNNNPSTYYIIPKSAIVGIIGAVIGLDREFMKTNNMYELLTNKIMYSIRLCSPFQIKSWSEYGYNHANAIERPNRPSATPSKSERLVDVNYDVYLMYDENDNDVKALLNNFTENIKANLFVFPPYLGMANHHADIEFIGEYDSIPCSGKFITPCICTNIINDYTQPFANIRTDDIPTRCKSHLVHDMNSHKTIYFHDKCGELSADGNYHQVGEVAVEFI